MLLFEYKSHKIDGFGLNSPDAEFIARLHSTKPSSGKRVVTQGSYHQHEYDPLLIQPFPAVCVEAYIAPS